MKKGTLVEWTCNSVFYRTPTDHNRYGKVLRVRGDKVEVERADRQPNEWLPCASVRPMDPDIKTPHSHPDHHAVGHYFVGFGRGVGDATEIFFCDAYDPCLGYWMSDTKPTGVRTNISERAPGRTWHEARKLTDYWWISGWGFRLGVAGSFQGIGYSFCTLYRKVYKTRIKLLR